jgi:hypothetical protein
MLCIGRASAIPAKEHFATSAKGLHDSRRGLRHKIVKSGV